MTRLNWDEYFMGLATHAAARSSCDRAKVGAVLVIDRHVIATGYNGSVAGLPHCDDIGHLMVDGSCVSTVHAEQNALAQAAMHGAATKGATLYVTHKPCIVCTKLILNAGIVRIVYLEIYRHSVQKLNEYRENIILASGVKMTCMKGIYD